MAKKKWCISLIALLLGGLCFAACASPHEQVRSLKEAPPGSSQGLVPQGFLCPELGNNDEVDPLLAQEIQVFIAETGILSGAPAEAQAQIPIVLNRPVKHYLNYFSGAGKANFQACLTRSGRYLPMIRRILKEHGLPPELAYLALVESGYNPRARSPADAVGLWQFIDGTARRYGLKVNGQEDERLDPEKSTHAAARYLKDLYRQFGCWYLAVAGYNAGENRVEGAMRHTDIKDFWALAQQRQLPQETCKFVPQFIAAALIARNPENYGFSKPAYPKPLSFDTVKVPGGTDLRRFAAVLQVSLDEIKQLNPELNQWVVSKDQQEYFLKVPPKKKKEAWRLAQVFWRMVQKSDRPGE